MRWSAAPRRCHRRRRRAGAGGGAPPLDAREDGQRAIESGVRRQQIGRTPRYFRAEPFDQRGGRRPAAVFGVGDRHRRRHGRLVGDPRRGQQGQRERRDTIGPRAQAHLQPDDAHVDQVALRGRRHAVPSVPQELQLAIELEDQSLRHANEGLRIAGDGLEDHTPAVGRLIHGQSRKGIARQPGARAEHVHVSWMPFQGVCEGRVGPCDVELRELRAWACDAFREGVVELGVDGPDGAASLARQAFPVPPWMDPPR